MDRIENDSESRCYIVPEEEGSSTLKTEVAVVVSLGSKYIGREQSPTTCGLDIVAQV
jgi:hypothetical protein